MYTQTCTLTYTHRCGEGQASSQAFTLTSASVLISQETWAPSGPTEKTNYRRQSALRGQILSFLNLSTLCKKWDGTVLHWQAPPPVCIRHHRSHGQSFRKAAHLAQQGQGGFLPMKSHRGRLLPLWRKGSCATRPPCHYFILGLENFSWLPHCLPRA